MFIDCNNWLQKYILTEILYLEIHFYQKISLGPYREI